MTDRVSFAGEARKHGFELIDRHVYFLGLSAGIGGDDFGDLSLQEYNGHDLRSITLLYLYKIREAAEKDQSLNPSMTRFCLSRIAGAAQDRIVELALKARLTPETIRETYQDLVDKKLLEPEDLGRRLRCELEDNSNSSPVEQNLAGFMARIKDKIVEMENADLGPAIPGEKLRRGQAPKPA